MAEEEEVRSAFELLEPAAQESTVGYDGMIELSRAISSKRQADALERIAEALWGNDKTTGIVETLIFGLAAIERK